MSSFLLVNYTGFKVYTDCGLLNQVPVNLTFHTHYTDRIHRSQNLSGTKFAKTLKKNNPKT